MLDIIVEKFEKDYAFDPQSKAIELFKKARMNDSSITKVLNANEDKFVRLPKGVMQKVIFSLNNRVFENFDKNLSLGLVDYDGEPFITKRYKFDHNLKILFIGEYSKIRSSKISILPYKRTFEDIEQMELKFNKSVLDFNKEDIEKMIEHFRNENINYLTYRYTIKSIDRFLKFAQDGFSKFTDINLSKDWNYEEVIKIIPEAERPSTLVSYETIMEIAYSEGSIQNAIVPILIFEGVKSSRVPETNELTRIKKDDIEGNFVHVTGDYDRIIELTDEEAEYLDIAKKTNEILKFGKSGSGRFISLKETGYLIRSTGENQKSLTISEAAIQKRLRTIRSDFENLLGDNEFTTKSIRTSGMVHWIDKLIEQGVEQKPAIYQTLIRFGDITEEEIEGPISPGAYQKAHRLRSTYLLHKGKK